MPELDKLNRSKDRILGAMRIRGPSLPVHIAREIGVTSLFAGAFLSELKSEDKLKISDMKVGSSPLYYLAGQEAMLERFVEYLNQREREAFFLLQKEKVLEDRAQTPVVRVALRAIKDFAVLMNISVNNESKLFWRYFLVGEREASEIISQRISRPVSQPVVQVSLPIQDQEVSTVSAESGAGGEIEKGTQVVSAPQLGDLDLIQEVKKVASKEEGGIVEKDKVRKKRAVKGERKVKQKMQREYDFSRIVKEYLQAKDVEILEIFLERKREFLARVRIDTIFGKQEYYLTAKDKKNIGENDLTMALQRANASKMPSLFMTSGGLNARAKEYLRDWRSLIAYEKIKV